MTNLLFIPPAILILSGHKSCTHKSTFALKNLDATIPGIATVIGDGVNMKILSNLDLIKKSLIDDRNAKEK
jgi:hypothetical protein